MTFRRKADALMHIEAVVGDVLDYSINWADWLQENEEITSSVWTVPAPMAAGSALAVDAITTQWIIAAAAGSARIDNRIGTSFGRFIKRSFVLDVIEALS
jgi:hypothetical protein